MISCKAGKLRNRNQRPCGLGWISSYAMSFGWLRPEPFPEASCIFWAPPVAMRLLNDLFSCRLILPQSAELPVCLAGDDFLVADLLRTGPFWAHRRKQLVKFRNRVGALSFDWLACSHDVPPRALKNLLNGPALSIFSPCPFGVPEGPRDCNARFWRHRKTPDRL